MSLSVSSQSANTLGQSPFISENSSRCLRCGTTMLASVTCLTTRCTGFVLGGFKVSRIHACLSGVISALVSTMMWRALDSSLKRWKSLRLCSDVLGLPVFAVRCLSEISSIPSAEVSAKVQVNVRIAV